MNENKSGFDGTVRAITRIERDKLDDHKEVGMLVIRDAEGQYQARVVCPLEFLDDFLPDTPVRLEIKRVNKTIPETLQGDKKRKG